MTGLEVIPEHGLFVVKRGIDRVLAYDMEQEWEETFTPKFVAALCQDSSFGGSELCGDGEAVDLDNDFFSATFSVDRLMAKPDYPASARALGLLGLLNKGERAGLTINSQGPETAQGFHFDNRVANDRVVIIHGGDAGAFDYCPNNFYDPHNPRSAKTVELDGGDVLISTLPYLFHQGRNRGDVRRFTFAHTVGSDEPFVRPTTPHGQTSTPSLV